MGIPVFWEVALRRWGISDVSKERVVAFIFKGFKAHEGL
jgi:hypothetical protein